jgi:hypothetical protein
VSLSAAFLERSLLNFGALTSGTAAKLANNTCLRGAVSLAWCELHSRPILRAQC